MRKAILFLIAVVLLLGGCAPWYPTNGEPYIAKAQNVSVNLPAGWMRQNRRDIVLATRDGLPLQTIMVETIHVNDDLKYTKKKFSPGMLPQEQAETIIDNMTSNQKVLGLKVLENKPAKIDGRQGFRALISFKDSDGLAYRSLYYGFMEKEWFYGLRYTAPQRHYFERDREAFDKAVSSVKLLTP